VRYAVTVGFLLIIGLTLLVSGQVDGLDPFTANASSRRWIGVGVLGLDPMEDNIISGRYWFGPRFGMELAVYYEKWINPGISSATGCRTVSTDCAAILGGMYRLFDYPSVDLYMIARVVVSHMTYRVSVDDYSSGEPDVVLCAMGGIEWSGRYTPEAVFCVELGAFIEDGRFFPMFLIGVHHYFPTARGIGD